MKFKKWLTEGGIIDPRGFKPEDLDLEPDERDDHRPPYQSVQRQRQLTGIDRRNSVLDQLPRGMSSGSRKKWLGGYLEPTPSDDYNFSSSVNKESIHNENIKIDIKVTKMHMGEDGIPGIAITFVCNNAKTKVEYLQEHKLDVVNFFHRQMAIMIKNQFDAELRQAKYFGVQGWSESDSHLWKLGIVKDALKAVSPLFHRLRPDAAPFGTWDRIKGYGIDTGYVRYFAIPAEPKDNEIDWRPTETVPEDFYAM